MNTLKRTLALVATLAMSATALASCGSDDSSDSKAATTGAAATEGGDATEAPTEGGATEAPTEGGSSSEAKANSLTLGDVKLGTGGSQLSVVAWNADDAPALLKLWENNGGDASKSNFVNMDCKGGEAAGKLDNLFLGGGDLDVYFCEADWALKFINDDTRAAALEDLGFSEDNFTDTFAYTGEIGRATKGANAGKMVGATWQSCPGGFAYNAELAEQYLGVKTPEEMQEKVADWDKFVAAATEVAEKSNKKVALADSLGGMWQVFAANRTSPWVEDGILEIDASCKTFADYAKTLWDNGGVTHNEQWSESWIPAGQNGDCMGYFASTWGLGGFVKEASANSAGKWKLIQGPDPYFWGGTWMVVNPKTDNAEEAQQLIFDAVVNPTTMKEYSKKPEYVNSISVMNDVVSSGDVNEEVKANFGGQNYFEPLHANAQKINLKGLITPYDASIKSAFLKVVTENYCKDGDWDACKDAFNKLVNKENPTLD